MRSINLIIPVYRIVVMSDQIPLPTVDLFTSELESVGLKWYDLGIFLGISTHQLDVIVKYHGSEGTQRCLIELFKCFQYRSELVSWNDITDALTKIHNNYLADRIRDKYIRTVSSSYSSSPPHSEKRETGSDSQIMETNNVSETHDDKHIYVDTKMHLIDQDDHVHHNAQTTSSSSPLSSSHETTSRNEELEDEKIGSDSQVMETGRVSEIHDDEHIYIDKTISFEFNKISTSFTSLVLSVKHALQRKSVSIDDLQEVLQDQCKLEPLSTEVATFQKIFTRMRQHYCFLNYHILTYLVDMFFSNKKSLQQLLVDYTNKLEKFKESVMMKDLMKLIKEKRDLCGNHKIIELKTRDFWGVVTLNKFERLAMLIFQNLYDCATQIRIEDGCICVSWVIPDIDTSILVTVSSDLLKVVGVISLEIEDKVLYEGPNEGCHILESAFLQAVELRNIRAVELLLAVGCDTNILTHTGELAITSAMKLRDRKGLGAFHLACLNGHTEVVSILLAAGISPEVTTNNLITPLMMASWNGHSVVVSTLLTSGADPNMADKDGWTPLMVGSQNDHGEVLELLLKAKVNPNACNHDGVTALYIASQNGHAVVVSTLLTSGADPNMAANDRWTPLMIGSQNDHSEVLELLLKAKVNPNARNSNGVTAIYIACQNGNAVVVSTLLTSGADPNMADNDGWTPLMIGSQKDHSEVLELLLKAKVNPNACNHDGVTALYIASQNGHAVVVSTLLTSGADPNMADNDGWMPLMIGSQNDHSEVLELLLKAKVDPNARNNNGVTATYIASRNGHAVVVSTLLTSGADPNMADNDGWTPLMIGSQNGHSEVLKLLLKAKVNPNACNNNGVTAIYIASQNGHSVTVSTLLTSGADPNMTDNNGWTPLIMGSHNGHKEVVEVLLKAKVNPNTCNNIGATAIYIASQNGHSVVVSTLLTSDADPNIAKRNGWTPLLIGSQNGHNEVVEVLLKAKVNPNTCNSIGATAIYIASQNGHSVVVSTLLTSGADPNIGLRSNGWTPLLVASTKGHTEVVKQLIEHGDININYQAVAGITALHLASQYGHIDIVRILLESAADSRLANEKKKIPLDFASRHRQDVVKLFNEFSPSVGLRSLSKLPLTSISTTDTRFYGGRAIITELSSDSSEEDDVVSNPVSKPKKRVIDSI